MALINTWPTTANNKLTTSGLTIRYQSEIASDTAAGRIYKVTRTAAKNYSFIGMSLAAARQCEQQLCAKYYRRLAKWRLDGTKIVPDFIFKTGAVITNEQNEGDNHSVAISVNEEDTVYTNDDATSLEACRKAFLFAEVRDYDEGVPAVTGIAILLANFDSMNERVKISYATNIEGFDTNLLSVQWFNAATDAWVTITSTMQTGDGWVSVATPLRDKFRLLYNSDPPLISNEAVPNDDPAAYVIHLRSVVNDVEGMRTTLQYSYNGAFIEWWNYLTVEELDELSGEFLPVPADRLLAKGAEMVIVEMSDGERHAYRLRVSATGSGTEYSNQLTATGDAVSDYTLQITSATNAISAAGDLVTIVEFVTNLDAGWIGRSNFTYRFRDGVTESVETDRRPVRTSSGWRATLVNAATLGDQQTVTIEYGELHDGRVLMKSNEATIESPESVTVTQLTVNVTNSLIVKFQNVSVFDGEPMTWDWGDGTVETGLTAAPESHTYELPGTYTIKISGGAYGLGNNFVGSPGSVQVVSAGISAKILNIGDTAFYDSGFTALSLPRVVEIGSQAFNSCGSLTTLNIPQAAVIGANAFGGTPQGITVAMLAKTMVEVGAMEDYPWGLANGSSIKCSDGTITVEQ